MSDPDLQKAYDAVLDDVLKRFDKEDILDLVPTSADVEWEQFEPILELQKSLKSLGHSAEFAVLYTDKNGFNVSLHYELDDAQFHVDWCMEGGKVINIFRKALYGKFKPVQWELAFEPGHVKPVVKIGDFLDREAAGCVTEEERIVDTILGEDEL